MASKMCSGTMHIERPGNASVQGIGVDRDLWCNCSSKKVRVPHGDSSSTCTQNAFRVQTALDTTFLAYVSPEKINAI